MANSLTTVKDEKDIVLFVSKMDHIQPSSIKLSKPESQQGLILSDGNINWMCPCLDGMATGPCGIEFRNAFACYHNSKQNPQGKDCLDKFRSMQECMERHPLTYQKEHLPQGSSQ
ncbi:mitochondrial intermembrane space import and assembly protein 40-B-like [Frankliniella occidentalis]|uniref:Mitochondrial intermembrane space import and assembly protein 40-B-like n=1 Tax=Frankliniella occidentalis TaxID=133901 RepID=A0A9C6XTK9_FRAOC|nr:mitochondrial intermembrane space import and assembly protein 40-B-like [Frankliniella occidentalis]